ncbi:MAG: hypothetical protein JW750_05445 [Anaerolineaceae bacterium]|nr:hypothetical protein [Anaerolineaceae bacterium]
MESIAEKKEKWLSFYELGSCQRFLLQITIEDSHRQQRPYPRPDNTAERMSWTLQNYERWLKRSEWLFEDTIPFLDLNTGTELFAEVFGCHVHYPADNMPFALPLVQTVEEADALSAPSLDHPAFQRLFMMSDQLRAWAGSGTLLRLPDLQTPMDVAALVWDKNSFYPALIESPEVVARLAEKIKQVMFLFLDEWFRRYGPEFIAHYPDYYMPFGVTVSEDEVGAVSAKMFRQYFLPELVEFSERYGQIGMHCCADARHQWDAFKQIPGLRLINLVQPDGILMEAYSYFADTSAQLHSGLPRDWWTMGAEAFPPGAHVVAAVTADSDDEAKKLADRFHQQFD